MKKAILLLMGIFLIILTGCTTSTTITITIPDVDSVDLATNDSTIYADGSDYSYVVITPYDIDGYQCDLEDYIVEYTVTPSTGANITESGRFTATKAGKYTVQVKVDGEWSNSITITAERSLEIVNESSTSIHLITWEPTGYTYWFTPQTEYSQFYNDNGDHYVPTLKAGKSYQQSVAAGTSYLYFVMTGDSDFGYYRTKTKVAVGSSYGAADGRSFEFVNRTPNVETDEDQNDLTPVPVLREVIKSETGVRTIINEIQLIKITKEEMKK